MNETFDTIKEGVIIHPQPSSRKKKGFVTDTKLGTNNFFVAANKNFAAATKRFVDRIKHLVVVSKYVCYPYFDK